MDEIQNSRSRAAQTVATPVEIVPSTSTDARRELLRDLVKRPSRRHTVARLPVLLRRASGSMAPTSALRRQSNARCWE